MGMTESVVTDAGAAWLQALRRDAEAKFHSLSWPNRKTEDWRYAFLPENKVAPFMPTQPLAVTRPPSEFASSADFQAHKIVFLNGQYFSGPSAETMPEGLECVAFSAANEQQQAAISSVLLAQLAGVSDKYQALALSALEDGVFIRVMRRSVLTKPIHLQWVQTAEPGQVVPQVCVFIVEEGAEACLIEQYVGEHDGQDFLVGSTYMQIGERATVGHYALQQDAEATLALREQNVFVNSQGSFSSFQVAMGAELQRKAINIYHRGEHSESTLNGIYLPKDKHVVDFHTCLEHEVPNTKSNEIFRGIINDQSKAVFNGRIHIHPKAQKTSAVLSNKNLLTSDKAEVNTKPELEIYADDVQCAHGATVAQLDDEALHYLKTRGVPAQEALVMLSYGFINALVEDIQHDAVSAYLKPLIANVFAKEAHLKRHLL